ncbi:MAG: livH 2 [Phycisphaerales bacterium]|nr:livH 2 [Phycisphaerales bacterium]
MPLLMPRWVAPILIVAFAVGLQWVARPLLGQYAERVAMDAGIAVVLAVSLNIVNGYTGQFSIGHAAFFAIGAYTAGAVTYYASLLIWNSPVAMGLWSSQSVIFIAATILGGLVAAAAGWLIGLPSLRLRGDYLAIVTLGFGEILRVLLQQTNKQLYTREELHAAKLGELIPPPIGGSLGFINVPKVANLFWVGLFVGITLLVAWRLKKSTFGRSMIAIRENEIAAESMGVNVTRLKVWAFVFAAFFAGVAGSLYAHEVQLTPQDAGFLRSFDVVIMVVLGGLGSITGATLAAALVTVAGEWLREPTHVWHLFGLIAIIRILFWPTGRLKAAIWWAGLIALVEGVRSLAIHYQVDLGEYRMIVFALVLILTMILRPGGLMGTHEITDALRLRNPKRAPTGGAAAGEPTEVPA